MAHYGEVLVNYEFGKDILYKNIDEYFKHPTMVKIKNVGNYSMYMCKMYCLLSNQCRYIIAFIIDDNLPLGSQKLLKNLHWESFQTRTLDDNHELKSHGYQPTRASPLNKFIKRIDQNKESSTYLCEDFSLIITLLHTDQHPNQYKDEGNVLTALETYQTILTFKPETE